MILLASRMIRASKLEALVYAEAASDSHALSRAAMVVLVSSVAAGMGAGLAGLSNLITATSALLAAWLLWSYVTFLIGSRLLPQGQSGTSYPKFLRAAGFSSSPGTVRILGLIPGLSGLVFTAASIWMMLAMVIAVQQALDCRSTSKALIAVVIGWLAQVAVLVALTEWVGLGPGA